MRLSSQSAHSATFPSYAESTLPQPAASSRQDNPPDSRITPDPALDNGWNDVREALLVAENSRAELPVPGSLRPSATLSESAAVATHHMRNDRATVNTTNQSPLTRPTAFSFDPWAEPRLTQSEHASHAEMSNASLPSAFPNTHHTYTHSPGILELQSNAPSSTAPSGVGRQDDFALGRERLAAFPNGTLQTQSIPPPEYLFAPAIGGHPLPHAVPFKTAVTGPPRVRRAVPSDPPPSGLVESNSRQNVRSEHQRPSNSRSQKLRSGLPERNSYAMWIGSQSCSRRHSGLILCLQFFIRCTDGCNRSRALELFPQLATLAWAQ